MNDKKKERITKPFEVTEEHYKLGVGPIPSDQLPADVQRLKKELFRIYDDIRDALSEILNRYGVTLAQINIRSVVPPDVSGMAEKLEKVQIALLEATNPATLKGNWLSPTKRKSEHRE